MVQTQGMNLIQKYGLQLLLAGFLLATPQELISGDHLVTDYGAVGDGVTLNAKVIQKAIDECALEGGGRVVIGPGQFL